MANDYIVRLQGEDNLSGTIRNVQRSINELGGSANRLDAIQQRFNRIEQSSAPLKKKLKDVKAEMERLAAEGGANTEAFRQMAQAAARYKAQLDSVSAAIKKAENDSKSFGDILKDTGKDIANKFGLGGLVENIGAFATPAGAATVAAGALATVMVQAGKSAAEFETHLDSLQSLTGLSDDAMKAISDGAIEMSKEFKSSASDIVDAMKLIGSQAPELLSDKDALMEVTKAANVLAEAAQIEVVDAAKGITTVMNQMGVSASEASNIINVLAASSQQGSADVAYLNTAFEKAGTAAKSAGMDYVQLSAAIETIAPKFSSADVAGSQLASTLLKLSMSGNSDFMPSVVGMSQALENMAKAEMDDVAIKNLVGESNVTMLKSLIEARETFDGYTQSLAGTNTALEQMAINNDNFEGKVTKLQSAWDAFLIELGQSTFIQGTMDLIIALGDGLMQVIDCIMDVVDALCSVGDNQVISGFDTLNVAWDALVAIVKGCVVAIEIVIRAVDKLQKIFIQSVKDGCNKAWDSFKGSMSNIGWVQNVLNGFQKIGDFFKGICDYIINLWNKMCDTLGMEDKKVTVNAVASAPKATPVKSTTSSETTTTTTSTPTITTPKGGKTTKVKTSTTKPTIPTFEVGSLASLESAYRKLDDELKNTVVSDARLQEILSEKAALDEQIKQLKIRNGLLVEKVETPKEVKPQAKEGSIGYVQKQLSDKQAALKMEVVGSDDWKVLSKEIKELTDKAHIIDVQIAGGFDTEEQAKKFIEAQEAADAYQQKMSDISSVAESVGNAFSSLGGAIGGTAGKMVELTGQTAQAVAQIIPQIVALIGAKQGEALASGTASAAALPFPANIAAIASIVATITALFASFAGSFADGGIIGGGTFHGDNMIARVNAGEMILNPKQQSNLFRALDSGGATGGLGGKVSFEISGSNLKGTLRNYDKKIAKMK